EPPAPLPDDIPPLVRDVVARAMARDPTARPASMRELGDLIDRIPQLRGSTPIPLAQIAPIRDTAPTLPAVTPAPAIAPPPPTPAARRMRALPFVVAGLVVLVGVAIFALATMKSGETKRSEVAAQDPSPPATAPPPPPATPPPPPVVDAAEVTPAATIDAAV